MRLHGGEGGVAAQALEQGQVQRRGPRIFDVDVDLTRVLSKEGMLIDAWDGAERVQEIGALVATIVSDILCGALDRVRGI